MRRPVLLAVVWLAAAAACTTLGWLTVELVSGEGRDRVLPPLSEAQAARDEERPPESTSPTASTVSPTQTTTNAGTPLPTTTTTNPSPAPAATSPAPPPAPPQPDPAAPTPQPRPPAPPPATTPTAPPAVPPPQAPAATPTTAAASTATINSNGGSVAVRYHAGTVTLLWATPRDGYTMEVKETGPERVEVRFRADDDESRIFAWWDGSPRQRVEERDHGD